MMIFQLIIVFLEKVLIIVLNLLIQMMYVIVIHRLAILQVVKVRVMQVLYRNLDVGVNIKHVLTNVQNKMDVMQAQVMDVVYVED